MGFFLKGLAIGFSIAAPVGPIGVLCIRRSLAHGWLAGFVTGLGAATADALYGAIAAFGLTAVSSFLVGQRLWLGLVGGALLCYLGLRTFIAPPPKQTANSGDEFLAKSYFSTFVLTLTNPMTILSFVAVFTGLGLLRATRYYDAGSMVAGVFMGSALWWLILGCGVGLLRKAMGAAAMRAVNWLSGAIIFGFGAYAVLRGVVDFFGKA